MATLREESFAGINFREFFAGQYVDINFRELGFTKKFAGVNFREWGLARNLTRINFRVCLKEHFFPTWLCGFENDLSIFFFYLNKWQKQSMVSRQSNTQDFVSVRNSFFWLIYGRRIYSFHGDYCFMWEGVFISFWQVQNLYFYLWYKVETLKVVVLDFLV